MPDNIETTIYKLELDGSNYLNGVDKLSASTAKLSQEQERANKALQQNEEALKSASEFLQQSKKDLDSYTGTNEKYRQQLTKTFQSAQKDQEKLSALVADNRKQYEEATAAAQQFATVAGKASGLPQAGTGKVITPAPLTPSAGITDKIASIINIPDFVDQAKIANQTKHEFDDLRTSISLAEARMKQLNATDEEFKQLAPIVAQGREALHQYDLVTGNVVEKTTRLRTEIFNTTDELTKMREAGKENTQQYQDLQDHVANLTKEYREQRSIIKILSSETRAIDFGKAAVQTAVSGFQAYTAISILAGDQSEELQKKTMQLFAAMQLLASMEQLVVSLKKGSIIATNLQSAATAVYTAVVGASTAALSAFKIALASAGIGAAVLAVGYLVSKFIELKEAEQKATEQQRTLVEINKKAADSYADEVVHLKFLTTEYDAANTSAKRKNEIIKELEETYPNYFKDLDKHADKEAYIAEQVGKVTQALILQAEIQAAQGLLAEKFKDVLKQQFDPSSTISFGDKLFASLRYWTDAAAKADVAKIAKVHVNNAEFEYQQFGDFIGKFVADANKKLADLGGDPHKPPDKDKKDKAAKKALEDDFEARKAAILEQIAKLAAAEFQGEVAIRQEYAEKLKKAILDINKDKSLKPGERKELITLTTQLNTSELDKALKDYHQKQKDAQTKLNDELRSLEEKNIQTRINLIKDEFKRRAAQINFNEQREIEDEKAGQEKRLEEFEKNAILIFGVDYKNNQDYIDKKEELITLGEQRITQIQIQAARERNRLSAEIFKKLLDSYNDAINSADLVRDEDEAKALQATLRKFQSHKISFEQFQKDITKIQDKYNKERLDNDLQTEINQLAALDRQIAATKDKTSQEYKDLLILRDKYRKQIAADQQSQVTDTQDPRKSPEDTAFGKLAKYVAASAQLADSVVGFWQAANDAEAKALDRSISLQEKRVDQAQKIALRGNAQYLKAEEDRLRELNIKRENAARKQLGIDAALQASQVLVAITGAVSRIGATPFGAETIADIAIIVGALATGYGIVKSLQGNQPKLAEGTPYVSRGTNPRGRDTIPAWLDEGEAVTSAEKNRQYHPTIRAIHDGTIPPDHLNDYVKNYHRIKATPRVNYEKIKEVGELKMGQDGKMSVLLSEHSNLLRENNDLQRQILKKNIHVEQKIDRDGVSSMVTEYQKQIERNKRI